MGSVKWHGRAIDLDAMYFICFPDQKRDLSKQEARLYEDIKKLPDRMQLRRFHTNPELSPLVLPVTGRELIDRSIRELAFPVFDMDFVATHRVTLVPVQSREFFDEHSDVLQSRFKKR